MVICPPSRDLNAGFVKLVEISQSSQVVLCIHHILEGRAGSEGTQAILVSLISLGPSVTLFLFSVCSLRSGGAEVYSGSCFATTWWVARNCCPVTWKPRSLLHHYLATE